MNLLVALSLACAFSTVAIAGSLADPGYILVKDLKKGRKVYMFYISQRPNSGIRQVSSEPFAGGDYCIGGLHAGRTYYLNITEGEPGQKTFSTRKTWVIKANPGDCPGKALSPEAMGNLRLSPLEMFRGITIAAAALRDRPKKEELIFGYGMQGPRSSFGTVWKVEDDAAGCNTFFAYPQSGQGPMHSWSCARMAGNLGYKVYLDDVCKADPYAILSLDLRRAAGSALPSVTHKKGLRILLRLGPGHAEGRQHYDISLRKASISGGNKNDGSDYAFLVKGERLSREQWREIKIGLPLEGKMEWQPSEIFAQSDRVAPAQRKPWGTGDLTSLEIAAAVKEVNFDILVGGVAFY